MDVNELLTFASTKLDNVGISTKCSIVNGYFEKNYTLHVNDEEIITTSNFSEIEKSINSKIIICKGLNGIVKQEVKEWFSWME